jgi:hypothetical protein
LLNITVIQSARTGLRPSLDAVQSLELGSIAGTIMRELSARIWRLSEAIRGWFQLVANIKAKYSIQGKNTYNFDKSGFMMDMISTEAVVTSTEH